MLAEDFQEDEPRKSVALSARVSTMYCFYIDDSGDPGLKAQGSPTDTFVLSALIVRDSGWLSTLDQLVSFRRFLRQQFGLRMRDELKAKFLVHGTGPFSSLKLGDNVRKRIYKMALRLQQKVGTIQVWAIAIDKNNWASQGKTGDVRERAWQYMLQRIERFTTQAGETALLFPDEGHPKFVKSLFRKGRRFNPVLSRYVPGQTLARPATYLVEDPNFRESHESYFVQMADLNSYAAYRRLYPHPAFGRNYWDELGAARVQAVNRVRGGPTGIVVWP